MKSTLSTSSGLTPAMAATVAATSSKSTCGDVWRSAGKTGTISSSLPEAGEVGAPQSADGNGTPSNSNSISTVLPVPPVDVQRPVACNWGVSITSGGTRGGSSGMGWDGGKGVAATGMTVAATGRRLGAGDDDAAQSAVVGGTGVAATGMTVAATGRRLGAGDDDAAESAVLRPATCAVDDDAADAGVPRPVTSFSLALAFSLASFKVNFWTFNISLSSRSVVVVVVVVVVIIVVIVVVVVIIAGVGVGIGVGRGVGVGVVGVGVVVVVDVVGVGVITNVVGVVSPSLGLSNSCHRTASPAASR